MDWASEKKGFAFAFGAGVRWQLGGPGPVLLPEAFALLTVVFSA